MLFGRYKEGGRAAIRLDASLTGEDKRYETVFDFPEVDTDYPEIERLWAMSRVEEVEDLASAGLLKPTGADDAIRGLGVEPSRGPTAPDVQGQCATRWRRCHRPDHLADPARPRGRCLADKRFLILDRNPDNTKKFRGAIRQVDQG